jgi:hypothetical protein
VTDKKTRDNHYVPQWYQRGFLSTKQSKLYYLNLHPDLITLPNGSLKHHNAIKSAGTQSCFNEYDLYTTFFGNFINDDIEKKLFGNIDLKGSEAVRAFIQGDLSEMHLVFEDFFEYLDAQKLRTPKGLDWIKTHYPSLSQVELMREMQALRYMHCTMWTEGVREIVTADNSDVKFIISDHPVTFYNAAVDSSSELCLYPNDPNLAFIGTQTVFVLDANTCLILTHLEYAKSPEHSNLLKRRTNARFRGPGLVRTDAWIRSRKLSRQEVIAINHLLKNRAKRYIAASNKDWLYPENEYKGTWSSISKTLLPKDSLFRFGGEIYVSYKDGSTSYYDEFGRTNKAHEFLKRKVVRNDIQEEDLCGCGCPRKYKDCCKELAIDLRPSWDIYSIRERNLMLCRAIEEIVGANKGKDWNDIRRDITSEDVKEIHKFIGMLWPEDTDLAELLPRHKNNILRAVYLGAPDARTIVLTVIGWLAYFDEIVIAFPFINPRGFKPEMNPVESPTQFKDQTLRNIFLLWVLQPFIDAGYIHLIPDPSDYNSDFGRAVRNLAEERKSNLTLTERDLSLHKKIMEQEVLHNTGRMPIENLKEYIKKLTPNIKDDILEKVALQIKQVNLEDPLAPLQPLDDTGQVRVIKGFNLDSALFIAMLTGSVIYTDLETHWKHLNDCVTLSNNSINNNIAQVCKQIHKLKYPLQLNHRIVFSSLKSGEDSVVKKIFKQLKHLVTGQMSENMLKKLLTDIESLKFSFEDIVQDDFESHIVKTDITLAAPLSGFDRAEVRRLILTFSRPELVKRIPMVFLVQYPIQN